MKKGLDAGESVLLAKVGERPPEAEADGSRVRRRPLEPRRRSNLLTPGLPAGLGSKGPVHSHIALQMLHLTVNKLKKKKTKNSLWCLFGGRFPENESGWSPSR